MKARDNPFAVDRVLSVRYQWAEGDIETLGTRLEHLHYRAAIVGGHGTGKTTLLEDLETHLAGLGFRLTHLRLDSEHRCVPRHCLSQLSATLEPRDLTRYAATDADSVLVVRPHNGLGARSAPRPTYEPAKGDPAGYQGQRPWLVCLDGAEQLDPLRWMQFRWHTRRAGGLLITSHRSGLLPTLIECTASPKRLERIMHQLAPEPRNVQMPSSADLFARHHGNLRNALRELYDLYAES